MGRPLGNAIGNALEVMEACDTLKGVAPEDLTETCIELAANMLFLAGKASLEECRDLARGQIDNGEAFVKLHEMVEAQGGNSRALDDYSLFAQPKVSREVRATESLVFTMDTERTGIASVALGAGRATKEDAIDLLQGLCLQQKLAHT